MKIEIIKVGNLLTNCYILTKDSECIVIDPGYADNKIMEIIKNKNVVGIIITHYHFDHIGGLNMIKDKHDTIVYDCNNLKEGINNIKSFNFEVIYTPGHKEDGITIYFKDSKVMFTGDFIFNNDLGRTDLLGGNALEMKNSLEKMKKYNQDIVVYPGHGPKTLLGREVKRILD